MGALASLYPMRLTPWLVAALLCVFPGEQHPLTPIEPGNFDLIRSLPSADMALPDLARIVGNFDAAQDTIRTARLIYRHFIYDSVGVPREAIPPALEELFQSNVGQCDTAARLFVKLRGEDGDSSFRQFDLITVTNTVPRKNRPTKRILGGHTIAALESPSGSVGVDPTYGLMFLSKDTKLTAGTLREGRYTLYRLYETPPKDFYNGIWPGIGTDVLTAMKDPDSDAGFAGASLRASSAVIPLRGATTILGSVDNNSSDLASNYGAWLDHIGYYFTPGSHVWNFQASDDGSYEIRFQFAPGSSTAYDRADMIPKVNVAVGGSASLISPREQPVALTGNNLVVDARVRAGAFSVTISTTIPGARRLDAIVVERTPSAF